MFVYCSFLNLNEAQNGTKQGKLIFIHKMDKEKLKKRKTVKYQMRKNK